MSNCTPKTKLLRQVPKAYYDMGKIAVGAFLAKHIFIPTDRDEGHLSVHNGDMISAKDAYEAYTLQYKSCGVIYVTEEQCISKGLKTKSSPSKTSCNDAEAQKCLKGAHHIIDYTEIDKRKWKQIAAALRDYAEKENKGFIYGPF